jgi:hypothetical protein
VHSLTYTFDNYTNTGIQVTTALTKNWIIQTGVTVGSDTMPWNIGQTVPNLLPGNPIYPGATIAKDPGAVPSVTLGFRWTSDDGRDDLNLVADAINGGQWGYNNLQWLGGTYYHKFNDYWHIAVDAQLSDRSLARRAGRRHIARAAHTARDHPRHMQRAQPNSGNPGRPSIARTGRRDQRASGSARQRNPQFARCHADQRQRRSSAADVERPDGYRQRRAEAEGTQAGDAPGRPGCRSRRSAGSSTRF